MLFYKSSTSLHIEPQTSITRDLRKSATPTWPKAMQIERVQSRETSPEHRDQPYGKCATGGHHKDWSAKTET